MSAFPHSCSNVLLSDVSTSALELDLDDARLPAQPALPISINLPQQARQLHSTHTPLYLPRINSVSHVLSHDHDVSLNSQILSFSALHDQMASEVDYSAYFGAGQPKHLFAHTPGTTHYHSLAQFSLSHKALLALLSALLALHWCNHGIFDSVLSSSSSSSFSDGESALILSASLMALAVCSPCVGYLARSHPPLRILWCGYTLVLLSTFITAFCDVHFAAMFWYIYPICSPPPNCLIFVSARLLMGVGDAAIIPIAAPLVLYTAPPAHKSLMLSVFLSAIPFGYAAGYFVANEVCQNWKCFEKLE